MSVFESNFLVGVPDHLHMGIDWICMARVMLNGDRGF
jgi:hypothetical protein